MSSNYNVNKKEIERKWHFALDTKCIQKGNETLPSGVAENVKHIPVAT